MSYLINKTGSWFSFDDQKIGQGRENAKAFLKEDKKTAAKIEGLVKEFLGMEVPA